MGGQERSTGTMLGSNERMGSNPVTLLVMVVVARRYWRAACRVMFGTTLAFSMVAVTLLCKTLALLPLSKSTRERWALLAVQASWRLTLALSFWVRTHTTQRSSQHWRQFLQDQEQSDKAPDQGPAFVLSNHVSFFDTLLTVNAFPQAALGRTRCYMGAHLYKLPLLGTICRTIGHFPVHFTTGETGKFTVDKVKQEQVEKLVDAHVASGGTLALYPEGQMNPNPGEGLLPFRYGAFRRALECDARLWGLVTVNHEKCWPRKAQIGGFPATTGIDFQPIAPKGSQALLRELRASGGGDGGQDKPDYVVLAEGVQQLMQVQHNALCE